MKEDLNTLKYFAASERVQSLIFSIEMTMEFMEEFQIKPDEAVKVNLMPIIDRLKKWTESK